MIKIATAQLNFISGYFEFNLNKIIETIEICKSENVDLIIFPELALCGNPLYNLADYDKFLEENNKSLSIISQKCKDISVIIGGLYSKTNKAKNVFNSIFYISDNKINVVASKHLSENNNSFCDDYLKNEEIKNPIRIKNTNFLVQFSVNNQSISQYIQDNNRNNNILINLDSKPFVFEDFLKTSNDFSSVNLPIINVEQVGAQGEIIFAGNTFFRNSDGNIISKSKLFEEEIIYQTFDEENCVFIEKSLDTNTVYDKNEIIYNALILGIKDYFEKNKLKQAILGLSGGLDSAVVLTLLADAIGSENVLAVLLPSEFSTDHSVKDALDLVKNLNCKYEQIPIRKAFNTFLEGLSDIFENMPFDVAEENIQARIRMVFLMAIANKKNYVLINTSNKSEAAVGYGTMYGDTCGALSVIGDLYKTEVYELANYINRDKEIIPIHTIIKPPSAELRENQKDQDSLPDYSILDNILYNLIENNKSAEEIISLGFDKNIVNKVIRLVKINEWKRHQTPPCLKVSKKAFGVDYKIPLSSNFIF